MSALPPPIASTRSYAVIAGVTALVGVLALAGVPLDGPPALVLLGAAVLLTGMPHGAIDHLVARRLFEWRGPRGTVLFYGGYLGLSALYGFCWWLAPVAALSFFLAIAAYHFGQADLAHLAPRRLRRMLLYLSRGVFVVGSLLMAHPDAVAPLVNALAGTGFAARLVDALVDAGGYGWVAVLTAQHVLVLLTCTKKIGTAFWRRRELLSVAVLAMLFSAAPPLAAFAVYFGLWHALGHMFVLLRFFRRSQESSLIDSRPPYAQGALPHTVGGFYRQAALYTAFPLIGLAATLLLYAPEVQTSTDEVLAALFVLVSVLTLPHMLLVERLYRHERWRVERRGSSQAATPDEGSSSVSSGFTTNEGGSPDG
jgi:Brp/Blh family beta-carotene 15,15'-monooxygenase